MNSKTASSAKRSANELQPPVSTASLNASTCSWAYDMTTSHTSHRDLATVRCLPHTAANVTHAVSPEPPTRVALRQCVGGCGGRGGERGPCGDARRSGRAHADAI